MEQPHHILQACEMAAGILGRDSAAVLFCQPAGRLHNLRSTEQGLPSDLRPAGLLVSTISLGFDSKKSNDAEHFPVESAWLFSVSKKAYMVELLFDNGSIFLM